MASFLKHHLGGHPAFPRKRNSAFAINLLPRSDVPPLSGAAEAVDEHERLLVALSMLGYDIQSVPKAGVCSQADLIMEILGLA